MANNIATWRHLNILFLSKIFDRFPLFRWRVSFRSWRMYHELHVAICVAFEMSKKRRRWGKCLRSQRQADSPTVTFLYFLNSAKMAEDSYAKLSDTSLSSSWRPSRKYQKYHYPSYIPLQHLKAIKQWKKTKQAVKEKLKRHIIIYHRYLRK